MTRPFQPIPRLTYEAVASQEEIYLEEVEEELRAILIFDDPTYFVTEKYEVPEMLRLEAARGLQAYSVSPPNNLVNALLPCADSDERDHTTVARDKGTSLTVRLHHRNRDAAPKMRATAEINLATRSRPVIGFPAARTRPPHPNRSQRQTQKRASTGSSSPFCAAPWNQ